MSDVLWIKEQKMIWELMGYLVFAFSLFFFGRSDHLCAGTPKTCPQRRSGGRLGNDALGAHRGDLAVLNYKAALAVLAGAGFAALGGFVGGKPAKMTPHRKRWSTPPRECRYFRPSHVDVTIKDKQSRELNTMTSTNHHKNSLSAVPQGSLLPVQQWPY